MRVVLTGASGHLGAYLIEALMRLGHDVSAWSHREPEERGGIRLTPVDLTDAEATNGALARANPDVILHAAALSSTEGVRRDPERGRAVNVEATARLADWCTAQGRRLIFTSTDLVFDGTRAWNREDDPAEPVVAYGKTKREAEDVVLASPRALVTRVCLLYGPSRCGREGFFDRTLTALGRGEAQSFFEDEFRTPLDFATAASILGRLVTSEATGRLHLAGAERVSRFELMRRVATAAGLDPSLVLANRQADAILTEPRPADVSLDTTRLAGLFPDLFRPSIEDAVRVLGCS